MCFAGDADDDGALLHSLGGVLDLEYSALGRAARRCVSDKLGARRGGELG